MTRRSRRTLLHCMIFVCALVLVVYLGRPSESYDDVRATGSPTSHSHHSSTSLYNWRRVRYETTAKKLPPHNGVCPGLKQAVMREPQRPVLVVSHVSADGSADWLTPLAEKYHLCIYEVDRPNQPSHPHLPSNPTLQTPQNRGHEAMAYLTFLIDNYAHIPTAGTVFVHGSRRAWHNDAPDWDNQPLLASLNVSAALEHNGYHNLRCDWSASTCEPATPAQAGFEVQLNAKLGPRSARWQSDAALPAALAALFGGGLRDQGSEQGSRQRTSLARSDVLRSQCCAQFAVSRERIYQHERAEYVSLRQWLLDGEAAGGAPRDDRIAGRILSYLWHVLFLGPSDGDDSRNRGVGGVSRLESDEGGDGGEEQEEEGLVDLRRLNLLACPSAAECYCRLYGRCELRGCVQGRCPGQYRIPAGYRMPRDHESD